MKLFRVKLNISGSFGTLKSLEGRLLLVPCNHSGECKGPLVVCLHEGEGVQELAPLCHVVHVLECRVIRIVQVVEVDHHGLGPHLTSLICFLRFIVVCWNTLQIEKQNMKKQGCEISWTSQVSKCGSRAGIPLASPLLQNFLQWC